MNQVALELDKTHGEDAPPFEVVKSNLQRVVSIPGFIGCVHDAMTSHPVKALRRAAQRQIGVLEKEIGFDIRVIKGSLKLPHAKPEQDAEMLHAQLVALRSLSPHLVVVFDEFQRLRHSPGDPLSVIRSALMSSGANHVSLLFTGSIRNAMKMMLEDSGQPGTAVGKAATLEAVIRAHNRLVQTIERSEFAAVLNVLVSGDEGEVNEVRALQLLADRGGDTITSRPLVDERDGSWYIVDPLFNERLRRSSPLADPPGLDGLPHD